jgi:DNA-binding response OmpR family regulator
VRALRVKLGSARGLPRLETVRGVGYVLRPPRVAIPARSSA